MNILEVKDLNMSYKTIDGNVDAVKDVSLGVMSATARSRPGAKKSFQKFRRSRGRGRGPISCVCVLSAI